MRIGLVLMLLVACTVGQAQEGVPTTMEELRTCLTANLPAQSLVQEVRLVSGGSGGRTLGARVYGMRLNEETAVMINVEAPPDMSGSRYLVIAGARRDAMFMYLPALNRTRRIVGSMAGQSLWGTDFSYEDVKLLRGLLVHGDSQLVAGVEWEGRPALKVMVRPAAEAETDTQYTQVELTVDGASCVVVSGRFFDDAGPVKNMWVEPRDLQEVDGHWMAKRVQLKNLRERSSSELYIDKVIYDRDLAARLFDPRTFMHGR